MSIKKKKLDFFSKYLTFVAAQAKKTKRKMYNLI